MTLDLRRGLSRAAHAEHDRLRQTVAAAFDCLADVLTGFDASVIGNAATAIERLRAEGTADVDTLAPLANHAFEQARLAAAEARRRSAEQRTQIADLVALVRSTVAAVAGDQASFEQAVAGVASRFERLAHIDDLPRIQATLADEVATLTRVMIERREAWEQTRREFSSRLSHLESQLDHTRREAALDPLTNVANRRTFERTCRDWLQPGRPGFVAAMIDVDDFKAINDRDGHATGDRVLVTVAATLRQALRPDDLVARLGGDEFAILAQGLTLAQADRRFTKIAADVRAACAGAVAGDQGPSISIGLTECAAGDTMESLQHRADAALYDAKRGGKGRVVCRSAPFIRTLREQGRS